MKSLKKIIKLIGLFILCLIIGVVIYLYRTGPVLPDDTDEILEAVIANPIPEMVTGATGLVNSNGVKIWYESRMPNSDPKGVILLIMGISNDALGWPPKFLQAFTDAGYQVIRFDHRGTGFSDWMEDYDKEKPYSLADMAGDGAAILDKLKVEKAHILGVSMGGMIAQQLAIDYPERVQSLTSIMSSGDILDAELPPISADIAIDLIKVAIKYSLLPTEKNKIKLHLVSRMILQGKASQNLDIKDLATQVLYNIRKRKGYNSQVSQQHQTAVSISNSRYEELKKLPLPTLIIHGVVDPFIPIEHGKKCVSLIPNVDSLWVENMGHDLPNELIPLMSGKIIEFMER